VPHGEGFLARALQTARVPGFDIVLESVGGSVLAKAPPKALSLIQGVLALTQDGLHIPAPAVVEWAEAIDAHIVQSEGRSRGKTVVRL
jgi:hypothetical protein